MPFPYLFACPAGQFSQWLQGVVAGFSNVRVRCSFERPGVRRENHFPQVCDQFPDPSGRLSQSKRRKPGLALFYEAGKLHDNPEETS
jgi:hypothetical protein